jgi:transposase
MIRLTDEQWERIRDHFPEEHIADGRPGRKPIASRGVLEAVMLADHRAFDLDAFRPADHG